MSKMSDDRRAMVDSIIANTDVENNYVRVNEEAYKKTLPKDIDYDTVKRVAAHNNEYNAAANIATAEMAQGIFQENPDVSEVTGTFLLTPTQSIETMAIRKDDKITMQSSFLTVLEGFEDVREYTRNLIVEGADVEADS